MSQIKYLNNLVEQDHRGIKRRIKPIWIIAIKYNASRKICFPGSSCRILVGLLTQENQTLMSCHRINELIELLSPVWQQQGHMNLVEILQLLADEAGHKGSLSEITDDMLIYHLKMRDEKQDAMIPGIAKDVEVDFKAAILKARGITN